MNSIPSFQVFFNKQMVRNFFFSRRWNVLGPQVPSVPQMTLSLFSFFFLLTQCNTQSAPGFVASYKRAKVLHHSRQQEHKTRISIPLL